MLQIKNIKKQYKTGELVQQALDGVSITLRDNEFVAILGPSGSGKTTLLNVIGGLDRYDSGELIINGISTVKYRDRDWDSYRNHTIGFVFQSYNLIPHQTVLSNVELALTISGVSRSERRRRAKEALQKVGLGEQIHKKPNQMSGGQMQRVAIARALVNDPDILLADEPTGALDSETSIQVMELLKEVAKDRLVVMVTHNPELAETYANRIIKLKDGKITDDTNPYVIDESVIKPPEHKNMGKSSMSLLTSLSLSFNNLRTKKGRTILTSFAGSIGIIGIALILSLSNGVNEYITNIQKETMTSYPISIQARSIDLSGFIEENVATASEKNNTHKLDKIYANNKDIENASKIKSSITENNLTAFKYYLDNKNSEINKYVGENGIVYQYNTKFSVYTYDSDDKLVNTDGSTLNEDNESGIIASNMSKMDNSSMDIGMPTQDYSDGTSNNFEEILPKSDGKGISDAIKKTYDLVYGSYPEKYDEVVLVLDNNNELASTKLYQLGILPSEEYKDYMKKIDKGEEVNPKSQSWDYKEICGKEFYMIPACDLYEKNSKGNFDLIEKDNARFDAILKNSVKLKITGVIRPNKDNDNPLLNKTVGYTSALTDYIIDHTNKSEVVKAQTKNKDINVLNGMTFSPSNDKVKIKDAKTYIKNLGVSEKAALSLNIMKGIYGEDSEIYQQMLKMDEQTLAKNMDEYLKKPQDEVMLSIYDTYISTGDYDDNLETFGVISRDTPSSINIYADSFEDKDKISDAITKYNETVEEEDKITYTDYVALLMSSVTTIVNVITYVLVAFVAVSLIVSSIMIGIITYISVLERTKEIGILRAIGASKKNISRVFNAETFIIGLFAGLLGIGICCLLLIPGNAIIHSLIETDTVNASISVVSSVVLIALSVVLTLIGGIIPSKKAARKDPVTALRTE
ncbi:MAG: ABC transporter ATP-binding protein/permease [Ruminococcus sp.]|nr:ABC transporter ATP-binding protein/permease [Ruminococcus sp.]